ncbi:protein mono-ADP-ribosyltransferase PARP4 isoform X2 [Denticeps clupeoides]|uniref:Poly [ADP-ribose] polymerase n=1 Tax=Denticeps clupeoides TaxID=299321 RepID=A0AAY4D9K1_9TELE|nr:protein mono-ADP-ribosyltransferase PARP4 isoform X2 [Denticeps clupeoides]
MTVFSNCTVVLDLKNLPFKEKKKLNLAITDNGGSISYVVNTQCTFIATGSWDNLSSSRQRSAQKHQIPVVNLQYIWDCLEKGVLLPTGEHCLTAPAPTPYSTTSFLPGSSCSTAVKQSKEQTLPERDQEKDPSHRVYSENDRDLPAFPSLFEVAKYSLFEKVQTRTWSVLELQSAQGKQEREFRVVRYVKETKVVQDKLVFLSCSEDALETYLQLRRDLQNSGFTLKTALPPEHSDMGSLSLQKLLLEEKLNSSTVSQEVGVFVELLWTEALGCLSSILTVPVTSISLNDVGRVEGLLLQVQRTEGEVEVMALLKEVRSLMPHTLPDTTPKARLISQILDLCQLVRDVMSVSEATMRSPSPTSLGKYRALRCSIECVPSGSSEFLSVTRLLQDNNYSRTVNIQQVLRVSRGVELQVFKEELGHIKPLLHSSSPKSFMGILSRGLLLPRVAVEHHGIERTDVGYLGSGIYFSDSFSTSMKYSTASSTDGSRLLLVCDVALGRCKDVLKKDTTLSSAPVGFNSVHGVQCSPECHSEFEDDEFVVYSTDQVRMKYVVQYTLEEDLLIEFMPTVDTTVELSPPTAQSDLLSIDDQEEECKNPLEEVTAGLLDSSGQTLPLQAVHVKCKLVDLLSQVVIFQTYSNPSLVPIEAKYVFPLEESAAVCGFEAFINGKHVIGEVKEKEQAHKEYRQAIEKGHGAYLMDQAAPDVFTISVGNLPPGATVLIKVTFLCELLVRAGSIFFQLPGSVAPWQESSALNERTQGTVEKVCVNESHSDREFSFDASIEMPYEITSLRCDTHQIKIKRTDCKAVISTLPGQMLGSDGFHLYITLSEMHMPRMWVENHPNKDSQACMLVFYPHFDSCREDGSVGEVIILLDTSGSMQTEAALNARKIALQALKKLDSQVKLSVLSFGTDQTEAFLQPQLVKEAYEPAKKFIMSSPPVGGSTELWRPLRSLSLLPPSKGVRNVLLISDGHIHNPALTLQLVQNNSSHTRLFTCGLSKTANRHMLRTLAQAGGGAYEFFDTKTKHTWREKVESQVKRMASAGCSSVAVKWQQFNPTAPPPVQAPSQLHALFSDCQTLVYGFMPHCTQAMLIGYLCGKKITTIVSTTELQKTKGTFLHKLTARAIIRDYEDGVLNTNEAEHEGKKAELKSYIIDLSKEFSILSQYTSFVAIEERDAEKPDSGFTDIPKLIAEEDMDLLPYMNWEIEEEDEEEEDEDLGFGFFDFYDASETVLPENSLSDHSENYESCLLNDKLSLEGSCMLELAHIEPPCLEEPPPKNELEPCYMEAPHRLFGAAAPAFANFCPTAPAPGAFGPPLSSTFVSAPPLLRPSSFLPKPHVDACFGSAFSASLFHAPPPPPPAASLRFEASHPVCSSELGSIWTPAPFQQSASPVDIAVGAAPPIAPPPSAGGFCFGAIGSQSGIKSSPLFHGIVPPVELRIASQGEKLNARWETVTNESFPTQFERVKKLRCKKRHMSAKDLPCKSESDKLRDVNWEELFNLQHQDGYWECTEKIGNLLGLDITYFSSVFLKERGIVSLGTRAHADILRLVATLLVLQLVRVMKLAEGELLPSLFHLKEAPEPRSGRWAAVKKAVDWVCWADRQYPCVCSRLEFGWDWESSTRQLLGFDRPHPLSPLNSVLERSRVILAL